jgi:hypothetical protein
MDDGVIVFGAGGHAKVVVSTLMAAGIPVDAIVDDDRGKWGKRILGIPVTGPDPARDLRGRRGIIAIGDNRTRQDFEKRLPGIRWEPLCIHARGSTLLSRWGRGPLSSPAPLFSPTRSSVALHR